MFGVLLESRARRHRRTGGAALSIAAHATLIGAIGGAAAHGRASSLKTKYEPVPVHFASPLDVEVAPRRTGGGPTIPALKTVRIARLNLPSTPGIGPVPDVTRVLDNICIGCGDPSLRPSTFVATNAPKAPLTEEWHGAELVMRILTPGIPRYPDMLRAAGIEGTVIVQFAVDTAGRVDMNSVKVLSSTHELFAAAVRDALGRFRFKPAEADGRRLTALAQMPFDFRLR